MELKQIKAITSHLNNHIDETLQKIQQRLKDHIDELCGSRPDRLIWCFLTSQGHAVQDCNLPAKNIHFPILPSDAAKSSNMYKHLSEIWWHSKQTWLLEPRSLEPALLAGSGAAQSSSIHACGHIWGLRRLSTKHTDTHTDIYIYIYIEYITLYFRKSRRNLWGAAPGCFFPFIFQPFPAQIQATQTA